MKDETVKKLCNNAKELAIQAAKARKVIFSGEQEGYIREFYNNIEKNVADTNGRETLFSAFDTFIKVWLTFDS
jgi:hypothetical protein